MSRLNEIKKVRYKLKNSLVYVKLTKEQVSFLCEWAEKGLVAISKTETTSCENGKTKTEKKYDNFRSYNIQGDCYKYVCSCIGCGQVLWEIEDYNYMKGERGCKPPFCPNCGRRLEADNGSDLY